MRLQLLLLSLIGVTLVSSSVIRRRSIEETEGDGEKNEYSLDDWLTEEQKAILEPLRAKPAEFKAKTLEFYDKLSAEEKKPWDEKYRKECTSWLKKVASEEEIVELEALMKSDKTTADTKRTEYEERLPEKEREMVRLWKDTCDGLLKARRRRHVLSEEEKEWLSWAGEEQRKVIEKMHEADEPEEKIHKKVIEYFHELPEEQKTELRATFKTKCTEWITEVASATEQDELRAAYENDEKDVVKTLVDDLFKKVDPAKQKKIQKFRGICRKLWKLENTRLRRELDANFAEFTTWMTDEQKKEIGELKSSGKGLKAIRDRTVEFFSELPADKQTSLKEGFKAKCKTYFSKISTPEEMTSMKNLYDEGKQEDVLSKVDEIISRQSEDVQPVATKMKMVCADVNLYGAPKSKKRRDVNTALEKHLSWLSDDQKKTVREMHANGKSKDEIRSKIFEFMNSMESDKKAEAREQTRKECYKWLDEAATKQEVAELHKLHETDHNACKTKVREYIARLPADTQAEIKKNLPFCEKVWYGEHDHSGHAAHANHDAHAHHHRRRRHLHAIEKYIQWLTPEQNQEVEKMEKDGIDFNKIVEKIKEFYKAQDDDKREELKGKFKTHCAQWVKDVATDEEIKELRALREKGDAKAVNAKLDVLEGRLSEEQKHTVEHIREVCLGVWEVKGYSRMRRHGHEHHGEHHHHKHTLDEALPRFLTWITEEQKAELKSLESAGDKDAIYEKVMQYFDEAEGETKTKAAEELKSACKHYTYDIYGPEKTAEIKAFTETGPTPQEMIKKVDEMIEQIEDPKQKEKAIKLKNACSKAHRVTSRKRRNHHHHTLKDALTKYLTWTTEEQKAELKKLEESGEKDNIYKKIMEYFEATEGETRKAAAEELKGACKHYAKDIFGEEKTAELKTLKESGAKPEDMVKKIDEFISQVEDEQKKAKALKLKDGCSKIYQSVSRKRRNHHHHTLKDALTKYLTWTTEEQKAELKKLEESGEKDNIYKKIMEYFEATEGETRKTAAEELKGACKHYAKDIFGEEKTAELKTLKESGAKPEEMVKKIDEFIAQVEDEQKKAKALKLKDGCGKIYASVSRKRRSHHHTLKDALTKYLTWTIEEQKAELKKLEESGEKDNIYKKIMEYFEATEGETRKTAAEELKGACKHYAKDIFGEEKTAELKTLKESGAKPEDMVKKIDEFISQVEDEEKKAKALKLKDGCSKIYQSVSRKRRNHHHHTLKDALTKYLTWTTEEQKAELKKLEESGEKDNIYKKIMEYFEATEGETRKTAAEELKGACKHYAKDIFGEEKTAELKTLKESGAKPEDMVKKIDEFISQVEDEKKKAKALRLKDGCSKIYQSVSRKRRNRSQVTQQLLFGNKIWLNEAQVSQLNHLRKIGSDEQFVNLLVEYFRKLSNKSRAVLRITSTCRTILGGKLPASETGNLVKMTTQMASSGDLVEEVNRLFNKIDDKSIKQIKPLCVEAYKNVHVPNANDLPS